ncbi:MAG: HAMP domain-containing histidine kinase [Hamadaea sp.]|uniref:sensor histidine kinase n=1 Tax=Hamadaea sp. TaxID=2024425 RepID=UPI0017AFB612|nr:HAMP domain-containing sensor histidine kinase [Hamadaea sp.]NUR74052.1 HAMP domain-containing histidine kinase [Hamadaea sp.]NUT22661.1 HAMP domain-containing histidine kinase [Hamadaea sp.]
MKPGSAFRHPIRTKPLRVKLMATVLALLVAAMSLIAVASVTALRRYLLSDLDGGLINLSNATAKQFNEHGGKLQIPSIYYGTTSLDGKWLPPEGISDVFSDSDLPALPSVDEVQAELGEPFTVNSKGSAKRWRVFALKLDNGQIQLIGQSQYEIDHAVQRLITINLFGGISVLLFAATIGAELIRRSMRPLSQIEKTASAIAAGDLSQRVPDPEPENPRPVTEVGSLARSLNTMLAQIETAFTAQAASEASARAAEQSARRSEERMRRFVADASHELRTPLTTIRGFAELYRQGAVTTREQTGEVVQRIENEAARMGLLVEDLLLLARLDRERPLKLVPIELRVLAAEAVEAARVVAPDRQVTLVTAPDAGHLVVRGDDARLRQVIGNLLSNALTHTPAGTPVIVRLASDMADGPNGTAVVEIHDRGPGLTAEQQERVFERFYRADPARTRRADGTVSTGLGLAIVAALVAAHDGTVEVESQPGVGATFRVRLPLVELDENVTDDEEPEQTS